MKTKILTALLAVIILLAACKSKTYEPVNNSSADSVAVSADTATSIKLVKTAEIRFKVKNVQQTGESIQVLTTQYKGMVTHHETTSSPEKTNEIKLNNDSVMRVSSFNTSSDMTVRIPSEKIEDFLNTISHMSLYVNVRRMDIEDKSLDYLSSQMKLNSRRELVNQQKKGKLFIKDPNAVLNLKDDLVDEQIDNKRINDAVKYSTISLSFYQSNTISKEVVVNDDPTNYSAPFFSSVFTAFVDGWLIFKELVILLVDMWVFILIGAGVCVYVRWYKRQHTLQAKM